MSKLEDNLASEQLGRFYDRALTGIPADAMRVLSGRYEATYGIQ
ncbi:MAG: hypothetical protein AB8G95_24540 [Anaerolineae bacterium]